MAKVKVNQEKCIGCGLCVDLSPGSFVMKGDKAKEKSTEIKKIIREKEAADSCPAGAIEIK